jgi:hypothetical protein
MIKPGKYLYLFLVLSTILGAGCQVRPSLEKRPNVVMTTTNTPGVLSPVPLLETETIEVTASSVPTSIILPTKSPLPVAAFTPTVLGEASVEAALVPQSSLILYSATEDAAWVFKTLPSTRPFDDPVFADFYGAVVPNADDIALYFLAFRPQLSPSGRFLLLPGIGGYPNPTEGSGAGLWLVDIEENGLRQLLPQAKAATWSPDSEEIAYIEGNTLYMLAIEEGAAPVPLFSHPELQLLSARWSPDGRWIAVVTTATGLPEESDSPTLTDTFWLVSTGSESPIILAEREGFAIGGQSEWLSWSADSQYLLVRGQNEVLDLAGKQILPPLPGAAYWIPGQSMLLVNGREGLRVMTVTGQEVAFISSEFASTWAVSRDGTHLAYSQQVQDDEVAIFIFDLTEQMNQQVGVLPLRYLSLMRWSDDDAYLIMDDMEANSPIWIMESIPNSEAEILLDRGVLIEVIDFTTE